MNKRGSVLVLTVVVVLIITSLTILIMGLILTTITIQKNNQSELVAHLELENAGYYYLNNLDLNNLGTEITVEDYKLLLIQLAENNFNLTVSDNKYNLKITFSYYDPIYEIKRWEITKNG